MKNFYTKSLTLLVVLFIVGIGYSQSTLVNSEYGTLVQNYLDQKKQELNLIDSDIADLSVDKEFFSKSTNITHMYVNQRYQGIYVYNALSSVAIKDNAVFYYANNFIGNINERVNSISPVIDSEQAIANVVSHFNLGSLQNLELISSGSKDFLYTKGNVSQTNIPVRLILFPTSDGFLRLSWDLSIHTMDSKNWWSVRVDAVSGEILDTTDWIVTCNFGDGNHQNHSSHNLDEVKNESTFDLYKQSNSLLVDGSQYNVFPIPAESPNHGPRAILNEPADINASPFGWHDTDGSPGAEYTITRGNNVWAMEDRDGNDGIGYSPDGTATLNFNFPLNLDQAPVFYEDVAITNLFYMNNIMHDVWYQYGFDEASGNFQANNYGNGGLENDYVFADAQDGSGLNNATFGTPVDGGNPGMTMFLWSATGPAGNPLTLNNGPLAGDYTGLPALFGDPLSSTPITADLALFTDNNLGGQASTDPYDACNNVINAASLAGKIVVIRRGVCEFGFKTLAAQNAGAIGVIMVNNVADPVIISMAAGAVGGSVNIPSIMISQADGDALIAELIGGATISGTLIDSGPYQKDGDFDNGIVAHEYGHGISSRLTGGANNANCLSNVTQMGEGWSDWYALMITMKTGDAPEDPRGIATYAIGQGVNGGGIRNAPYSTDFAINDFTYADTNDTANVFAPHGIGFVWSTVLWDLTWAYVAKYGFDDDFYNGTGGNNRAMQLVIDGLKLQQCSPGFVDGRDALLAADTALTGGEDQCMIWEVFANRGLGFNASEGLPFSRTDQVEDFTLPPDTEPSLANCTSLSVDDFNSNDYSIYPNPSNNILYVKTSKSFGEVTMSLTDLNGRQVLTKTVDLFGEVALDISKLQSGIYILNINGQFINTNDKIVKN